MRDWYIMSLVVFALQGCEAKNDFSTGVIDAALSNHSCVETAGADFIYVSGGDFEMGSIGTYPEEAPVRRERVNGFWIGKYEVSNADFDLFTKETGYQTLAERTPDPALHPDIPADQLVAGSALFVPPKTKAEYWWQFMRGANWRQPRGPGSDISDKMDMPVVHVAYADAVAYAAWKGGRLPSEKEWEYAARGGLDGATYEWGETPPQNGTPRANTWQGVFPVIDKGEDGFMGAAPTGQYAANGYGLYDMTGNVWEWVADQNKARNMGLIKGGSFLCADNFCRRYRPAAKQPQELDFSTNHIGFRVVQDVCPGP